LKKRTRLLIYLFLLFDNCAYSQQAHVSGYLQLDSSWLKKVYVSRIADFNQMFTASDKLIVADADIDSNGYFKASLPFTDKENLYRLHIIKKGDPVSTLIIGSTEENHVFFIAKNASDIDLKKTGIAVIVNQENISGGKSNYELNALLTAIKSDSINRDTLKNLLIATADSCNSELVGLLALYSTFGLTGKQKSKIGNILARYDKTNPYGNKIFEEYKPAETRVLVLLVFLTMVLLAGYIGYRIVTKRKAAKLRSVLSQRETSIVQLILEGKTNKEIANTFNIELSTVKTHVNNVYAKLKINNRKELQKYEHIFRG
jgi:DNA-binding CsgD family transcriptional regulator